MAIPAVGQSPVANGRPKIGLVLSGGGARGFAHVGTLKLLDSLQIPIDYIAGTSMGSLVAAAYAVGYSGLEIEQIIRSNNWQEFFSDAPHRDLLPYLEKRTNGRYQVEFGLKGFRPQQPSGLISGQNASLFLSRLYSTHSKPPISITYRYLFAAWRWI